jgi:tetratricopeptide (TPR) repeat protein
VKADCAKVFSHLSEAHQTLTDAKRREDYLVLLKEGGATPEAQKQIQGVLEAITLFQKAEILFKTRDFVQAETMARKALALDPRQAEYLAFVTWIDALKPENQPVEPTRKLIEAMSNAIKLSASCEKAYFYRGMLYKRIDQHALAIKDFKKSSELNPNNVDAAREVRLFYMRGGRSVPPAPGSEPLAGKASGLFGKFFKK